MALMRALVYGDSGAGKTYFVGTAMQCPETSPILVLNARGQPITFRLFEKPPLVINIQDMQGFNAPWEWIMGGQDWTSIELAAAIQVPAPTQASSVQFARAVKEYFETRAGLPAMEGEARQFKAVAIDSISWVQRVSMSQIVGNTKVLPGDMPARTEIQHWGSVLAQMTNLADLYYQLPIHVILTALCKHQYIEAYGTAMYSPALWGQSSLEIPSLAEILARIIPIESMGASQAAGLRRGLPTEMENAYNALLTRGGRTFLGKWQGITNNPEVLLNPTVQKVIDVIAGSS